MNISEFWQDAIVPALVEYIRIPAKSPHFDRDWQSHGYIDEAARLAAQWCERNAIAGMKLEIVRLEGRTPCLLIDVPGTSMNRHGVRPSSRTISSFIPAMALRSHHCAASRAASSM